MQATLDKQTDAYKVMFDKLDWYHDIITILENYLDKQTVQSRDIRAKIANSRGEYDYEAGLYRGMENAYSDVRVVLGDMLDGVLVDLGV